MRIQAINNNYYKYRSFAPETKTQTYSKMQNVTFKALFYSKDEKSPLQEKFDIGLAALEDEKTILLVTRDREVADYQIKRNVDSIEIPIEKMYILNYNDIKIKDSKNFVIYKKDGNFKFLNIDSIFGTDILNYKDEKYDSDIHSVSPNTTKTLKNGNCIIMDSFTTPPVIFQTPKVYNPKRAQQILEYKTFFDTEKTIKSHNTAAISRFLAPPKKTNSTQKEFTFADVGGLDDIILELRKYVLRPINFPEVFEHLRLNKGILLSGPPRCGKTLLGKALANEAGMNYKYMNANEFTVGVYGGSEEKARGVFDTIMKEPTILFIDEIDAIGKERTGGHNAQYDDKFLTQLLGSMSDLEKSETMSFVIAATNRKDLLDKALIETGRFGLHLDVPLPSEKALEAIYNVHAKKQPFEDDINVKEFIPYMFENKFNGSDVAETITNAYFNALERLGMNAKMDAKTFTYNDLKLIKIAKEDIWEAMQKLATQKAKIRVM